jgi:L-asparaginase / beta-aspartyl-peptidase
MPSAIIVHGGAWNIPAERFDAHRNGCRRAVLQGWKVLQSGGSALDAVEAAVVSLEDDPTFDAGTGSFLNADGQVELDAGLMDGSTFAAGAVAAVHRVRNPITLARRVLESEHVLIVGSGAMRFAEQTGVPLCDEADLVVERERRLWESLQKRTLDPDKVLFGQQGLSTVGAVALDPRGNIAAGTSTGGSLNKWPGRVGDVPLVGSGFYATPEGGASCTGWGEGIMRIAMAKHAVDLLAGGKLAPVAAGDSIHLLADRLHGVAGIILMDREGRVGYAHSTRHMAYAYLNGDMAEPEVSV